MKCQFLERIGGFLILFLFACNLPAVEEDYMSPVVLITDSTDQNIYVAEHTAKRVAVLDTKSNKLVGHFEVPVKPSGLALSADNSRLYVTGGAYEGRVCVYDTTNYKLIKEIKAGHTPTAPVLSKDGKQLFIANRCNDSLSVYDTESFLEIRRIGMTREPIAAVMTLDGKFLFVANHLPDGAANVSRMTSRIDVVDTTTYKRIKSIQLPNGAIDLRDITISHDGKFIYVPSILARFLVPTTQIERGWINTHALNIIDVATQNLLYTILLDDVDLGAANPWGVVCTKDGKYICVAHSATHEVSMIDREGLHSKLKKSPVYPVTNDEKVMEKFEARSDNSANDLSFLTGIRQRIPLKGNGPRGLTLSRGKLYAAQYFTDNLGVIELSKGKRVKATAVSLGTTKKWDIVRKGEVYFNDASLCFQKWQTCSTCHPDVRTDAVNWDLLNDGIGNAKSTKSLIYSHVTAPSMITGIRPMAEVAVRAGIRYIQFAVPTEEKALALDAYLKSLDTEPSPYLINGKLSESAKRGKIIFDGKAACLVCHSGTYYTNRQLYDAGTGQGREKGRKFDTTTLKEVWRTRPYLYEGQAATMMEVFTKFNKEDKHGVTSNLTEQELKDLVEYTNSL